mmetsp:Transcript_10024/g.13867  ORF Transcript_10024/g.13867 Transcript_10024/m.13867 type:complete len:214 (-) Transcript_10024:9-650(-)
MSMIMLLLLKIFLAFGVKVKKQSLLVLAHHVLQLLYALAILPENILLLILRLIASFTLFLRIKHFLHLLHHLIIMHYLAFVLILNQKIFVALFVMQVAEHIQIRAEKIYSSVAQLKPRTHLVVIKLVEKLMTRAPILMNREHNPSRLLMKFISFTILNLFPYNLLVIPLKIDSSIIKESINSEDLHHEVVLGPGAFLHHPPPPTTKRGGGNEQ